MTRHFPLLEALLEDDASLMTFQGLNPQLSKARPESMQVLEELLNSPEMSDEEGAEWVLDKCTDQLIGFEDKADYADYPITAMFCKFNYTRIPLTCLMLMSHGHTNTWTDTRVSQEVTPLYHEILKMLPASADKAQSMVEFCRAEYSLEAWKNAECPHVLTLLGLANHCIRTCGDADDDRRALAKHAFARLLSKYTGRTKSLVGILSERMKAFNTKGERSTTGGTEFQVRVDQQVNPLFRLIRDQADAHTVSSPSLHGYFSEFNDLIGEAMRNLNGCRFAGDAYEPNKVASFVLSRFAINHLVLTGRLYDKAPAIFEKEQGLLGYSLKLLGEQIRPHCEDPGLKAKAFGNMMIVLSQWLGSCDKRFPITPAFREQALGAFFEGDLLDGVLPELDYQGLSMMSGYVMEHHPSLRRKIPRAERGQHLSDVLGP
mgnify:FL=1